MVSVTLSLSLSESLLHTLLVSPSLPLSLSLSYKESIGHDREDILGVESCLCIKDHVRACVWVDDWLGRVKTAEHCGDGSGLDIGECI